VNSDGSASDGFAGNDTEEYGDQILCRCDVGVRSALVAQQPLRVPVVRIEPQELSQAGTGFGWFSRLDIDRITAKVERRRLGDASGPPKVRRQIEQETGVAWVAGQTPPHRVEWIGWL
jgi:hypothetical protein